MPQPSQGQAIIELYGTTRRWTDGTYASSCEGYRNPTGLYSYSGATGNGTYRIKPSENAFDVYCDMTTSGGGWTLVANANQVSTTFSSTPQTTVTSNFNFASQLNNWGATDKLVKLNNTTSLGVYTFSSANVWANGGILLRGGGTINLRYSGNADSAWIATGFAQGTVGSPNQGSTSWCDTSNIHTIYMNITQYDPGGVHPGVQANQAGCSDNNRWKDDFSWQVYSK